MEENIEKIINNFDEYKANKINWTKAWSKKYPVLDTYKEKVDTKKYANQLNEMLDEIENKYNYNSQDAMLILKDILYQEWKERKR